MKLPFITAAICAVLLLCGRAPAQGTVELLTSVGTTVENAGTTHAYLLWQPGEAEATLGKRFAIYRKSGDAGSAAPYARLGIQTLQTSANTIRAMLELGAKLDPAAGNAATLIDGIYRQITLDAGDAPAPPADPNLDASGKLAFIISSAVTDPRTLSRLFFLGRAHPGVMMALGHAFSISVQAGVHTFEIREIGNADDDIQVVGRVTLDTAATIIPQSPASLVRVRHTVDPDSVQSVSPKDHLNVRFRWGIPEGLGSQLPHTFGFDIFRVKKSAAISLGWHTTPPAAATVLAALAGNDPADPDPAVSQANELPILVGDLLTPAQAADPADTERFDFSDDGIWHLAPGGSKVRRPFADGESYYYFVAARGITGMPGQLSSGSLITFCDTLPPLPPTLSSVLSNFVRPAEPADWAAQAGSQFLQLKFRQLPTAETTGYHIYRWSSPQEYLNSIGNPAVGRIAIVPHVDGDVFKTFDDNGAGAPTLANSADKSVWYTVRAVGRTACGGKPLSGHSAPMPGFLRDFKAPEGPDGDFLICRHLPFALFNSFEEASLEKTGLPPDYHGFGVDIVRPGSLIVAADIRISLQKGVQTPLTLQTGRYSFQQGNTLHVDFPFFLPDDDSYKIIIQVRGITAHGMVSTFASTLMTPQMSAPYYIASFGLTLEEQCRAISTVPDNPPIHEAFLPNGDVNLISGTLTFPTNQRVSEWRVYRRVGGDGPLSLIAKAEGTSIPNPGTWQDDALPAANGAMVCYYGQILDQNANPSPLMPLGCTMLVNPDLPTPMLSPASIEEKGTKMGVKLEWFCDPVGVDRFEILVARQGGGEPDVIGLSPIISAGFTEHVSADFPDLAFHTYQTARIGGGIGNGPAFSVNIEMPADARAFFAVRACGPNGPNLRVRGSVSNVVSARWQIQPTGPQPVIPWPARPLPDPFDPRQAITRFALGEGPLWPLIPPTDYNVPTVILVGLIHVPFDGFNTTTILSAKPPENYLFKIRENREGATFLTKLMPLMLYRYQVPSPTFPDARANLVQCTPLIDRMSWQHSVNSGTGQDYHFLRDPFFMVLPFNNAMPIPVGGDWSASASPTLANPNTLNSLPVYLEGATGMLLLKDPLPVTVGAKYRHLIVRFDERGEIKNVIPLESVQH